MKDNILIIRNKYRDNGSQTHLFYRPSHCQPFKAIETNETLSEFMTENISCISTGDEDELTLDEITRLKTLASAENPTEFFRLAEDINERNCSGLRSELTLFGSWQGDFYEVAPPQVSEDKDHAKLVAAAPETRKMLRKVLAHMECICDQTDSGRLEEIERWHQDHESLRREAEALTA
jgi:hypothetical protein